MSWKVEVLARAEADSRDVYIWYEKQSPGLGADFLSGFVKVLSRLERNPDSSRFYYKDFRRAFIDRFPYKVFYRIHGTTVVVHRVLHSKRDHRRLLGKR